MAASASERAFVVCIVRAKGADVHSGNTQGYDLETSGKMGCAATGEDFSHIRACSKEDPNSLFAAADLT